MRLGHLRLGHLRLGTATALLAAMLVTAGTISIGTAASALAQTSPRPTTWSPDLSTGQPAGVAVDDGTATLDQANAFLAPAEDGSATEGEPVPTGLLTLPARRLDAPTDRVDTTLVGEVPTGSEATVDVRGRRSTGSWTEWIPATTGPEGPAVDLPEPTSQVQGRLVLTGPADASPAITGLELTAHPATARHLSEGGAEQVPLAYRVFATREGLVGGTTANGHVIAERDHFVALPSRRALSPRDTSDYSVKVCAGNGRCAFAPVWDVGPWNTRDDYWNPAPQRQEWSDLPQGVPQAQAAYVDGFNGGKDQYDRAVANPAGIDLGDGLFWDALGLKDNGYVTVDYLWTGSVVLAKVVGIGQVFAAPDAAAEVVGIAADRAAVPVECVLGTGADRWLRIGVDQYLSADSVPEPGTATPCDTTGDAPADGSAADDAAGPVSADAAADAAAPSAAAPDAAAPTSTDTVPTDTTPSDTTPSDTTPSDTTPSDTTPSDTTPSDTTSGDATFRDTSADQAVADGGVAAGGAAAAG